MTAFPRPIYAGVTSLIREPRVSIGPYHNDVWVRDCESALSLSFEPCHIPLLEEVIANLRRIAEMEPDPGPPPPAPTSPPLVDEDTGMEVDRG